MPDTPKPLFTRDFVRLATIHCKSNHRSIRPWKRASAPHAYVETVDFVLVEQRVVFIQTVQGLVETRNIRAKSCVERTDTYAKTTAAQCALKLYLSEVGNRARYA